MSILYRLFQKSRYERRGGDFTWKTKPRKMDNISSFEYEIFLKNDVYYLQVSR